MAGRLLDAIGAGQGIAHRLADYVGDRGGAGLCRQAHAAYKALFTEARWAATIGADIAGFTAAFEASLIRIPGRGLHPAGLQAATHSPPEVP